MAKEVVPTSDEPEEPNQRDDWATQWQGDAGERGDLVAAIDSGCVPQLARNAGRVDVRQIHPERENENGRMTEYAVPTK
jgi:hypothetical protein